MMTPDSPRRPLVAVLLTTGVLLAMAAPVLAQEASDKRWTISLIGFFPETDTNFTIFSPILGEKVNVDYEDELAVEDSTDVLRFNVAVRLTDNGRHLLELDYLAIDREGTAVIERDIMFGDVTFPLNGTVESQVETRDLDLHYTYMVVKKETGELGLSVGLHALRVESTLAGVITLPEVEIPVVAQERVDETFPLPLFGIRGAVDLSSRWGFSAGAKLLAVEIGDVSGSLLDAWARFEYRPSATIALGVGYAILDVDAENDSPDQDVVSIVNATYKYTGPEAFLRFRF